MTHDTTSALPVKKAKTSFWIEQGVLDRIRTAAEGQRRSITTCVDMALREWLERTEGSGDPVIERAAGAEQAGS